LGFFANDPSFYVLLINIWAGILIVSILLSLLAKCSSSLSPIFALSRALKGHEGRYMALFTMSFSLAHIASSKTGLTIIDHMAIELVCHGQFGILGGSCIWLQKLVQKTIPIVNSRPIAGSKLTNWRQSPFSNARAIRSAMADCCYPSRGTISRTTHLH
jgi:hypothetical protein